VRRAAADRHHHLQYAGADRRVRAAEARRGLPVAKKAVKPLHHGAGLEMAESSFPEPISLGARSAGWIESEIDAWIAQRIEQSRPGLRSAGSV